MTILPPELDHLLIKNHCELFQDSAPVSLHRSGNVGFRASFKIHFGPGEMQFLPDRLIELRHLEKVDTKQIHRDQGWD